MDNLTKSDMDTISDIVAKRYSNLMAAEWVLVCFDRMGLFQVATSLWDAEGIPHLISTLNQMLEDLKAIKRQYLKENIVNEKWSA